MLEYLSFSFSFERIIEKQKQKRIISTVPYVKITYGWEVDYESDDLFDISVDKGDITKKSGVHCGRRRNFIPNLYIIRQQSYR